MQCRLNQHGVSILHIATTTSTLLRCTCDRGYKFNCDALRAEITSHRPALFNASAASATFSCVIGAFSSSPCSSSPSSSSSSSSSAVSSSSSSASSSSAASSSSVSSSS